MGTAVAGLVLLGVNVGVAGAAPGVVVGALVCAVAELVGVGGKSTMPSGVLWLTGISASEAGVGVMRNSAASVAASSIILSSMGGNSRAGKGL